MIRVGNDSSVLPVPFNDQEMDDLIAAAVERQEDVFELVRHCVLEDLVR
jgi:hypothetical protein